MNHTIINAPLINPRGWGTLTYYDEIPLDSRRQAIKVSFDSLVTVNEIVLKNNTTSAQPGVAIKQNGTLVASTAAIEGSGFDKNIRVTLTSPIQIGPQGISAFAAICRCPNKCLGFLPSIPSSNRKSVTARLLYRRDQEVLLA
jgi:hypothetical protein